jgi:hypothetical protein
MVAAWLYGYACYIVCYGIIVLSKHIILVLVLKVRYTYYSMH